MQLSIIEQLQGVSPSDRVVIIEQLYKKNLRYFAKNHPWIMGIVKDLQGNPFQLNLTDKFLEIINTKNGERCHPEMGLDLFAQSLGDWTHNAWVEFLAPHLNVFPKDTWHGKTVLQFTDSMLRTFPAFNQRVQQAKVTLPTTGPQQRYSNPVLFAGIFHGLHIAHFLNRTEINNFALIEPDPFRFEVSLYFLDYSILDSLSKGLLLYVGDNIPSDFLDILIRKSFVTGNVWLRVLPGYASEKTEPIIRQIRLRWLALTDTWVAGDQDLGALRNGIKNLQRNQLLMVKRPKLSKKSRIAVIGAGPSLTNDLKRLKHNKDKVIIFAAHAAVRTLKSNDIYPDFQFSHDLNWAKSVAENLQLDTDIPFIVNYQTDPGIISNFKHLLMVAGEAIASPAKVHKIIPFMYPTTGNMVLALACYCQPSEIFLLGMDFGFHTIEQIHVDGSHYDEDTVLADKTKGNEQIAVLANFNENETVLTRAYFNQARQIVEKAVVSSSNTTRVFNLSDGAFIEGATPKRSSQMKLPRYLIKKTDIAAILSAFEECSVERHWTPYEIDGKELMKIFKTRCNEVLQFNTFSHKEFASIVDKCQFLINETCKSHSEQDARMIPYLRVVKDLLVAWYRFIVFTNSVEEAQLIYDAGFSTLLDIVNQFEWQEK